MEGDNLIITAKQEVKEAGGSRSRVFEQKFSLPPGVRTDTVRSNLNREGHLVVTASKDSESLSSLSSLENKMDRSVWLECFQNIHNAHIYLPKCPCSG